MEKPQTVLHAEWAIWVVIVGSAIGILINKLTGYIPDVEFVSGIIVVALFCIFPYKIGKGSNPARYVFSVVFAMSILLGLGGIGSEMTVSAADVFINYLLLPVQVYAIYLLFKKESAPWFSK